MQDQALELNKRMTLILSCMWSLSIVDSSDTRACSSSHFLQTMMNRSVLLLEIMNGKYLEVQDFLLQQFARKSLSCLKSWHWPIDLKLGESPSSESRRRQSAVVEGRAVHSHRVGGSLNGLPATRGLAAVEGSLMANPNYGIAEIGHHPGRVL